ncbi:sel1 repeat family protein [Streptomyces sp. NPDC021622]|uniref:sel1 repeat family protein n=1 Tax=Streptomyces sp. NPDC021622 TaxID=3155013 RepID=UPI0033CFDA1D
MEPELEELAASGRRAIIDAMGSDRWEVVRARFTLLFQMAGRVAWESRLTESRAERLDGDRTTAARVSLEWRVRLSRLMREQPETIPEVQAIVAEFRLEPDHGRGLSTCPDGHLPRDADWCEVCEQRMVEASPPVSGPSLVRNAVSAEFVSGGLVQSGSLGAVTLHHHAASQDHIDFSRGNFSAPAIGVQHNHYGTPRAHALADSWPRADQLRRTALGVRPVRRFGDESALPPYVARDCDDELNTLIPGALEGGGLVVVTGEPLSGKTMTAAWALLHRSVGDGARVHTPHPGTDLRDIPAQLQGRDRTQTYVVWLDDLEGHLGEHGLTAGLLAQLAHEGVLVLATMSDEAYDIHRFGGGPASRVLSGAGTVQLNSRWSEPELARLAEAADPRLVDAARWRGERGVTEYLAVGPELWDEWRRAARRNPLGHLLVRAAIDLARCGLTRGVTPKLLSQVQEEYGLEAADAGSESLEEALAWATEPRHGVTGLLVPGEWPGTWRAYGSLIADTARSPGTGPVPDKVWVRAYRDLQPHDVAELDGFVAAFRLTLTPQAANGDAPAMGWLGLLAEDEGDTAAAEDWYRKAADLGSTRAAGALGRLLAIRVAYAEAVPHLTAAADAGEPGTAALLGQVHQHLAVHYFRIAKADGDPMAGQRLKGLLRPTGQEPGPA